MVIVGPQPPLPASTPRHDAPVTAIIPCYRCGGTIHRAVASVHMQTWRPAELVVVDDGSGDDTLGRLEALQRRYPGWVRLIALPSNQGPATARNAGWEAARQPYLAFLDADDAWHPRKIEIQLHYMQAHPELALSGHAFSWHRNPHEVWPALPNHWDAARVRPWRLLAGNCLATRTVMLKRNLPLRFETGQRYSEDYLLWLRILLAGLQAAYIRLSLASCYKAPFGDSGLSAHMWAMEAAELANYWRLRREGLMAWPVAAVMSVYSLAKYSRRIIVRRNIARQ